MATPSVVPVQVLPPGPKQFSFDRHIFNKRASMVSQESHLAYSDITRMHVYRNSGMRQACRWTPLFMNNATQFRHVIMVRSWSYSDINCRKLFPPDMTWEQVKERCDARFARDVQRENGERGSGQWLMHERFKECVQQAGGYMAYIAAIAYRSWSLRQTARIIAEQMGMTCEQIRAQLCRLNRTAERLGYVTHIPHATRGRKRYGRADGISGMIEPRKLKFQLEKWHFENIVARERVGRGISEFETVSVAERRAKDAERHRQMKAGTYVYKFRRRRAQV